VLQRREVADEIDIGRPGEVGRILRAADKEAALGPLSRRFHEEALDRRLPVRRVGSKVGEIGRVVRLRCNGPMHFGIDMAVKRRDTAGAQPRTQFG
jgi:hypothetical protein